MTSDPLNQIELISTLSVPRYAPRLKPTPIPGANWNDAPLFCLKLNDDWVSHVLGVMTALDQPDTWLGTPEQIYAARQQVNEIMVAFMTACEDCAIQFRIEGCELQWRESEADEWISLGNICGADGSDGAPGEQGPQGEQGPPGEAGMDGADGINGSPGATGATGPEGPQGEPGVDGEDCNCTDYPPPTPPEGQEDEQTSCNIAGTIVDNILQGSAQSAKDSNDANLNNGKSIINLLAVLGAAASGTLVIPIMTTVAAALLAAYVEAADDFGDALGDPLFWSDLRCVVYCAIKPNSDIDEAIQATIAAAINASDYTPGVYNAVSIRGYLSDFFAALPLPVIRENAIIGAWAAYDCSGCDDCPDDNCAVENYVHWTKYAGLGSVVGYGDDYVEVESSNSSDFGAQAIGIVTATDCCWWAGAEYVVEPNGAMSTFSYYCGADLEGSPQESHVGFPTNSAAYQAIILYGGTSVFRVKIFLNGTGP